MTRLAHERTFEPENDEQRRALAFLQLQGSSQDPSPFPGAGDRVAGFVIEQELGRGGAGVVYRAQQVGLGRSVALKLIPHGPGTLTDAYARRLEREGRMLASVKHESIPTVHAAGVVPGFHYVAVDLVDGTTLKDLIHGRASGFPRPGDPRWLPFLLGLLHRVASALGAAHQNGIVHRDVKPENVLVDREGRPFLVNFGLAREQGSTGTTLTRGFVGTPQYASPEQLRGEPVGAASDVFSFGALAFEAVSGKRPFHGQNAHELAHAIQFADPAWPAAPRDLRAVIDRCLEKRAARRYADAREVEAEFARLLRFEPVLAVPRGFITLSWRRVKRHPVLATACLGLLLTSLGIAGAVVRERWVAMQQEALELRVSAAFKLFGQGRMEDYRLALEELLLLDPPPPRASGRYADLYFLEDEPAAALRYYQYEVENGSKELADWVGSRACLSDEPWEVNLEGAPSAALTARDYLVLALSYELQNDIAAAYEMSALAVDKTPMPVELHLLKVKYLTRLGKASLLARELGIACELRTWDATLFSLYAQTLHRLHRYEEEEQFLERALATTPHDAQLLAELAICKDRLQQRDVALDLASRAHALAPESGRVIDALASSLVSVGRVEDARRLLREAALTLPRDPHVLSSRARFALRTGALEEAVSAAEELASIGATDERWLLGALELRGRVQAALGATTQALATFRELEAREPEVLDWPLGMGITLQESGDLVGAAAALERAEVLGSIEPEVLWAKARLLLAQGEPQAALGCLQRALWRRAEEGTTHYWMAIAWLALGEPDQALHSARVAAEAHPDWPEARTLLRRCEAAADAPAAAPGAVPNEPVEAGDGSGSR